MFDRSGGRRFAGRAAAHKQADLLESVAQARVVIRATGAGPAPEGDIGVIRQAEVAVALEVEEYGPPGAIAPGETVAEAENQCGC